MNINHFSERIGELISQNKIQQAIQEMSSLLKASPRLNELVMQSGRYQKLKHQIRTGTINYDDAEVTNNKIMMALLDLSNEVGEYSTQNETIATETRGALSKMFSDSKIIIQKHKGTGDIIGGDKIINH